MAILVFAAVFIYSKLNNNANLSNFRQLVSALSLAQVYLTLGLVLVLMLLNWFLEALKWKFLIKKVEGISVWKSIESVFCGLTLAVFTPNRIGEYGGRVFFLSPRRRILGVVAMSVGAVGQMVITNMLGACAILWFVIRFLELNILLDYALAVLVLFFCAFFFVFYFNIELIGRLLVRVKFLRKFKRFFGLLARYSTRDLTVVFAYCLARFAVFTSQYCLIISMLIPEMHLFEMSMMVFILFFIQSALPSLDFLDVGVRTLTATYFFGFITDQELAIMAATACIWLVNLIIPAILGSVFVFKLNFFGSNS
ncbi:lysylphosphatidylglycerol synthase domain-containing protein [Pedobacter sp. SYSU D00535]|uniref:lysylphosphatidylglycerol synthase domain-containing protein n=1 Tax=Pedobacter sp. SYSU D00535 TaxID=2810308 RepID=UPI00351B6E80